jgi:Fis family transcriptional regulator, factor for inversion stimulation protein
MASKKKTKPQREPRRELSPRPSTRMLPLRTMTADALNAYFTNLNGHRPARLYDMVIGEVEAPLFKSVIDYVEGNQVRAAEVLGINRGTLRKKLKMYGLTD